jgi:MFS family permease
MNSEADADSAYGVESTYAWRRLACALAVSTIGGVGMWSVVVALPAIQAAFGVDRADASLPYTLAMLGFAGGGVLTGRLADRFGIALPLTIGTLALALGYLGVGVSANLGQVALAYGLLIGFGCSVISPAPIRRRSSTGSHGTC